MTIDRGNGPRLRAVAAAVTLIAVGAAGMYVYMRRSMEAMDRGPGTAAPGVAPRRTVAPGAAKSADGPLPDVSITLTDDGCRVW